MPLILVHPVVAEKVLQVVEVVWSTDTSPKMKSLTLEVETERVGLDPAAPLAVTGRPALWSNGSFGFTPLIANAANTLSPAADQVTVIETAVCANVVVAYHSSSLVVVPCDTNFLCVNVRPAAETDETVMVLDEVPVFTMITSCVPVVVMLHATDAVVVWLVHPAPSRAAAANTGAGTTAKRTATNRRSGMSAFFMLHHPEQGEWLVERQGPLWSRPTRV